MRDEEVGRPCQGDVRQQGEGLADVTTHLVDRIHRALLAEGAAPRLEDVKVVSAKAWPTKISREDFRRSTGLSEWPAYLKQDVDATGTLNCRANGEAFYTFKGHLVKLEVKWDVEAPAGGGDQARFVLRGKNATLTVRDDPSRGKPSIFVRPSAAALAKGDFAAALDRAVARFGKRVPGVKAEHTGDEWRLVIPAGAEVSHDAAFGAFTETFLAHVRNGDFPEAEYDHLLVKYRVLSEICARARQGK